MSEQRSHPIRVLVVDDDVNVGAHLTRLLQPPVYDVCVVPHDSTDLVHAAIECAARFRPHAAVVDLRLRDNYDRLDLSGFEVADHLCMTPWVLYSAYLTGGIMRRAYDEYGHRNLVRIINKASATQELIDAIDEAAAARTWGDKTPPHNYHWNGVRTPDQLVAAILNKPPLSPGKEDGIPELPPGLVDDLLYQLLPNLPDLTVEIIAGMPGGEPTAGARDSVVLKVTPRHRQPVVVKLASAEHIEEEAHNFSTYIDGTLAGLFRAQLDNSTCFWDLGAAQYTFMGSGAEPLPTFSAFYAENDPQAILEPLYHFFSTVWKPHYDAALPVVNVCLYDLYEQTLHLERKFSKLGVDRPALSPLQGSRLDPLTWARQHRQDSLCEEIRLAVTHGDLHGENLFVDGQNAWAIDYGRSGPGHALRDIAELEVDIVTRLTAIDDGERFEQFARAVITSLLSSVASSAVFAPPNEPTGDALADKALTVIRGLHDMAARRGLLTSVREYLWALLIDALFLMLARATEPPQRCRAQWFGAALCAGLEGQARR